MADEFKDGEAKPGASPLIAPAPIPVTEAAPPPAVLAKDVAPAPAKLPPETFPPLKAAKPAEAAAIAPAAKKPASVAPVPLTAAPIAATPVTVAPVAPKPIASKPVVAPVVRKPVKPVAVVAKPQVTPKIAPAPKPVKAQKPAKPAPASPTAGEKPTIPVFAKSAPVAKPSFFKETFAMTTPTFDFAAAFKTAFSDAQEKAKAAYEKSTGAMGDANEFAKGNVEALVESSKILASGLQELTTELVAESREAFESLTAEIKTIAAVKSPADFFKLQSELMRKQMDALMANGTKHSEAFLKLASDAATPLSNRVSLAVEKVKTAA